MNGQGGARSWIVPSLAGMAPGLDMVSGTFIAGGDAATAALLGASPYRESGDGLITVNRAKVVRAGALATLRLVRVNTSIAAPSAIASADSLGILSFAGYNGTALGIGASVTAVASENWTGAAQGAELRFTTVNDGSTSEAIVGRFRATGAFMVSDTAVTNARVYVSGSQLATSGNSIGAYVQATHVAAANADVLNGIRVEPSFTPGAFTGLIAMGVRVRPFSVAAFTSPGAPRGIEVGVVTGTGAAAAYGILVDPPAGATANYLFAHTTPATFSITSAGLVTSASSIKSSSPTAGIGYGAGAGGAVTQLTDKSTGVTSNTITTAITMNNATLNAATIVSFTFTNSAIEATDTIVVEHQSAGTSAAYTFNAFPGTGSAVISVRNNTAGNLSEAIVLRVTIIKSVSA